MISQKLTIEAAAARMPAINRTVIINNSMAYNGRFQWPESSTFRRKRSKNDLISPASADIQLYQFSRKINSVTSYRLSDGGTSLTTALHTGPSECPAHQVVSSFSLK
jgi:hypothetical protein